MTSHRLKLPPLRLRRSSLVVLSVVIAVATMAVVSSSASSSWRDCERGLSRAPRFAPVHPDSAWAIWVATSIGNQGVPPPAALRPYFPNFVSLYLNYVSVHSASKPSFSQWLVIHGVINPTTHRAMMMLYAWAEQNE